MVMVKAQGDGDGVWMRWLWSQGEKVRGYGHKAEEEWMILRLLAAAWRRG